MRPRLVEIVGSEEQELAAVPEHPQATVAEIAQNAADHSRLVAVVDVPLATIVHVAADCTAVILLSEHLVEFDTRHAEGFLEYVVPPTGIAVRMVAPLIRVTFSSAPETRSRPALRALDLPASDAVRRMPSSSNVMAARAEVLWLLGRAGENLPPTSGLAHPLAVTLLAGVELRPVLSRTLADTTERFARNHIYPLYCEPRWVAREMPTRATHLLVSSCP